MLPLISIVIPNFNHAPFLKKRLFSILNQSYKNFEIILLDDCSEDNSRDILNKLKNNPKVSVVLFNEVNSGSVIHQWMKGLNYCKGEYVWIAESDDYSNVKFLETVIEPMLSDSHIVLSYSNSKVVDVNDNVTHQLNYSHEEFSGHLWENNFIREGLDIVKKYVVFRNVIPNVSSALFRKSVLLKCVKNGIGYKKFSDWIIYFYVFLEGKISFNQQALNYFRDHEVTTRAYSKENTSLIAKETVKIRNTITEILTLTDERIDFQNWKIAKQQLSNSTFYDNLLDFVDNDTVLVISPFNNYTKHFLDQLSENKLKSIKEILDNKANYLSTNYKRVPVVTIDKSVWLKQCEQIIIFSEVYCDEIRKNIVSHLGYNINIITIGDIMKKLYCSDSQNQSTVL